MGTPMVLPNMGTPMVQWYRPPRRCLLHPSLLFQLPTLRTITPTAYTYIHMIWVLTMDCFSLELSEIFNEQESKVWHYNTWIKFADAELLTHRCMTNLPAVECCKLTKAKTFLLLQFCTFWLLSVEHTTVGESRTEQGNKKKWSTSKVPSYLLLLHIWVLSDMAIKESHH
jgi:hypothetical protein